MFKRYSRDTSRNHEQGDICIKESDFDEARQVAYHCLAGVEEFFFAAGGISKFIYPTSTFVLVELAALPADNHFSRTTRAVEYLCMALDYAGSISRKGPLAHHQADWNNSALPDKIAKVKKWLLLASTESGWRGCGTAHQKAHYLALDLWRDIERTITLAMHSDDKPFEQGPGFKLELGIFEEYVEEICEDVTRVHDLDIQALKAEVDLESAKALETWKADRIKEADKAVSKAPKDEVTASIPDGPGSYGHFAWQGESLVGLSGVPWRLVHELWGAKDNTLSIDDLAKPVWEKEYSADLAENALRSASSKANCFFQEKKVSYKIRTREKGRYASLEQQCSQQRAKSAPQKSAHGV